MAKCLKSKAEDFSFIPQNPYKRNIVVATFAWVLVLKKQREGDPRGLLTNPSSRIHDLQIQGETLSKM